MIALQEIIWRTRPDVVIETGIAHGGSLVYHASLLELLGGNGRVIGVDVEIRAHNRAEIEKHPMARRITLIEGSSVDPAVVARVTREIAARTAGHGDPRLESHARARRASPAHSPLVTRGCYLVVFDTLLEDMPADLARAGARGARATARRPPCTASCGATSASRSTRASSTNCSSPSRRTATCAASETDAVREFRFSCCTSAPTPSST